MIKISEVLIIGILMGEIDFNDSLSMRGERRRLKAATALIFIYSGVFALHLLPWGGTIVLGLLGIMTIHAVRLLFGTSTPQSIELEGKELPFVSLVVAAKNEEAVIANLVKNLCQVDYQSDRWELWVVDDNSSDRTPEILEKLKQIYPQLKVASRGADAKGGKSGALNHVLPQTRGDIIGVFDADSVVPEDFLKTLLPIFHRPRIGAVQLQKVIANASTNFWTKGQAAEMALDLDIQNRRICVGGLGELRGNGQFVRRSALLSCGGWNEHTITDDLDLTIRLHLDRWDIICTSYPFVQEEGVTTWWQLWHQRNRWAEGGYQRYLDYWPLIMRNKMGTAKTLDLYMFLITQYLLPTAMVPDFLAAIALRHSPLITPIVGLGFVISVIGMSGGIKRSYGESLISTGFQTLRGMIYMLHWIPVIASVTLRMSIRPKQLKWVKTVHQGLADSLLLEELES